jgi:hypothetical protein
MIYLKDVGIEDFIRNQQSPDESCILKINGEYKEYKITEDEFGWLYVILPLDDGIHHISLLNISMLLNKKGNLENETQTEI